MPAYIISVTFTGPFRAQVGVSCLRRRAIADCGVLHNPFHTIVALPLRLLAGERMGLGIALRGAVVANFRGLAEHTQLWHGDPPDPDHLTRSLVSNRCIAFFPTTKTIIWNIICFRRCRGTL